MSSTLSAVRRSRFPAIAAAMCTVAAGLTLGLPSAHAVPATDWSFDEPGHYTWTVPAGVTLVDVELWGAAGGGSFVGGEGGAGAYVEAEGDASQPYEPNLRKPAKPLTIAYNVALPSWDPTVGNGAASGASAFLFQERRQGAGFLGHAARQGKGPRGKLAAVTPGQEAQKLQPKRPPPGLRG